MGADQPVEYSRVGHQCKSPRHPDPGNLVMMDLASDKADADRSMSYTPRDVQSHGTIYQMLTGYPPDKVSPSGQLEPPSPPTSLRQADRLSRSRPPKDRCCRSWNCRAHCRVRHYRKAKRRFSRKAYDPYGCIRTGENRKLEICRFARRFRRSGL